MYKVINRFYDKEDNHTLYEVGEGFPKGNSKPSKKRIEELLNKHPKYGIAFIEEVKETRKRSPKAESKE